MCRSVCSANGEVCAAASEQLHDTGGHRVRHDLRHTGATMAAREGATLAELQERLGHSSVNAAVSVMARGSSTKSGLARNAPSW